MDPPVDPRRHFSGPAIQGLRQGVAQGMRRVRGDDQDLVAGEPVAMVKDGLGEPEGNHGKTMGKPWENGGLMGFNGI